MSKDLNQCNFIGRLGKDIELKYLPSGKAVANFSIACSDDYKNRDTGENIQQTNWINIVMFGALADVAGKYLKKGSKIFISGKQQTRKWQAQDGSDRYSTEIVANEMQMLDSRGSDKPQQDKHSEAKSNGYQPQANDFDDDIPF